MTGDTKRATTMDVCPAELDNHLILNSVRFDACPKVKAVIRDCMDQMRHKSDPREIDEMAPKTSTNDDGRKCTH